MEQAVWIAFSVISVVIGFSIVVGLINTNVEDKKQIAFQDAIVKLGNHCSVVCQSPIDTLTPTRVDLPSGMVLYTNDNRVCGIYEEQTRCELCDCSVTMDEALNLNTSLAARFSLHSYNCLFLRLENGTQMECTG